MPAAVAVSERPPAFLLDLVERPGRASRMRHLFDGYADQFDAHMAHLGYCAPRILSEVVETVIPGRHGLRVLDLGCGTGQAGAAFRDRAQRLDGVDLSPAMIDKARARGVYDALEVGDLETTLAAPGDAYDLILAADVLVYLGDLARIMTAVAQRLTPGGVFCFTVERKDGDGFELGPMRRWLHSEPYVRQLAADAGLVVAKLTQASSRTEWYQPVPGLAVALQRLAIPKSPGASDGAAQGGEGALPVEQA